MQVANLKLSFFSIISYQEVAINKKPYQKQLSKVNRISYKIEDRQDLKN